MPARIGTSRIHFSGTATPRVMILEIILLVANSYLAVTAALDERWGLVCFEAALIPLLAAFTAIDVYQHFRRRKSRS